MTRILTDIPGFNIENPQMIEIYEKVKDFARLGEPCVFFGPTGVGKEYLAKYYHQEWIKITKKPELGIVNCACLYGDTAHSELFGHKKGSFTGATNDHIGFFEKLNDSEGVLFLDEFGDLPAEVQAKLLRAVDTSHERKGRKLGDDGDGYYTDKVRVLAATEKEPNMIRPSLLNRMGYQLFLPSLEERKEDLKHAIPYFMKNILKYRIDHKELFNKLFGISLYSDPFDLKGNPRSRNTVGVENYKKYIHEISDEILEKVWNLSWPGNFRSLYMAISYGFVRCQEMGNREQLKKDFIRHFIHGLPDFTVSIKGKIQNINKENITFLTDEKQFDPEVNQIFEEMRAVFPKTGKDILSRLAEFFVCMKSREFTVGDCLGVVDEWGDRNTQLKLDALVSNGILQVKKIRNVNYYTVNSASLVSVPVLKPDRSILALPENKFEFIDHKNELDTMLGALDTTSGVFVSGPSRSGKTTFAINAGKLLEEQGHTVLYYRVIAGEGLKQLIALLNKNIEKSGVELPRPQTLNEEQEDTVNIARLSGYLEHITSDSNKAVLIIDNEELLVTQNQKNQLKLMLSLWKNAFRFVLVGNKKENGEEYEGLVEIYLNIEH